MRRKIGVLLSLAVLALLVCGLSVAVTAEDPAYAVYVGGVGMSDGTYLANGADAVSTKKPASGGYAYYDNGVLTLHEYVYEGLGWLYGTIPYTDSMGNPFEEKCYTMIGSTVDLKIVLEGTNTLTAAAAEQSAVEGIKADSKLTITAGDNGKLSITCNEDGISAYNAAITGGTIDIHAGNYGIFVWDSAVISGGTVDIDADSFGIYAFYYGGDVTISGGTVDISAEEEGIIAFGDVTISGGTTDISAYYYGINGTSVRIKGGTVDSKNEIYGIVAGEYFSVSGGTVTVEAGLSVISYGTARFIGGTTTLLSDREYAIASQNLEIPANMQITGGTYSDGFHSILDGSGEPVKSAVITQISPYIHTIYVGGQPLTTGETISGDTGTASYEDGVLTLNGYSYTGPGYLYEDDDTALLYTDEDLEIVLIGSNTLTADADPEQAVAGITSDIGDLHIRGTGTLQITAQGDGIDTKGNLEIAGSTITINALHEGINADGDVDISGGTAVIDASTGDGIQTTGTFRFTGDRLDISAAADAVKAQDGIEIDSERLAGHTVKKVIEAESGIYYLLADESGKPVADVQLDMSAAEPDPKVPDYIGKVFRSMRTVSFAGDGVEALDGLYRAFGSTVNLQKIVPAAREGYTFTGWFADAARTRPITKLVVTGDMEIYAGWEAIPAEEEETTEDAAG